MIVVIFGATGSAGGGVLQACLSAPEVTEIRAIVRRPLAVAHPKLRTIQHQAFDDYSAIADAFARVDACLYCLGKSSTQVTSEAEYRRLTYDYALAAARAVWRGSPNAVFQFVSGASTRIDSRYMWARVKAETERDLLGDGHAANCWRPASIDGVASASEPVLFRVARPLMRLLKPFRSLYVRAEDIGIAMLSATGQGIRGRIFENAEIRDLADRARGRI